MSDSGGTFADVGRPTIGRATMSDTTDEQVIVVAVDDSAPAEYAMTCKCGRCAGMRECVCVFVGRVFVQFRTSTTRVNYACL